MNRICKLGLQLLAVAILTAGCAPPEEGLELKIYFSPLRAKDPQPPGEPPPDITDFRICVSAADMSKAKCKNFNLTDYQKRGKARFEDLPVGSDRKVAFMGYNFADLVVHWCGEVSHVQIKTDATTKVTMFITACSDFTGVRNQMGSPRVFHTATKLPDGRVLVAGGFSVAVEDSSGGSFDLTATATNSVDIYDPLTGSFDSETGMQLINPRGLHTATLLPDGRVFIAGGCEQAIWRVDFPNFQTDPRPVIEVDEAGWGTGGSVAEIIDPVSGTIEELEDPLPTSRASHSDVLLPNGDVLLLGGMSPVGDQASAIRYLSSDKTFVEIANAMAVPRQGMLMVPFGGAGSAARLIWGGNHPPAAGAGTFAETLDVADDEVLLTIPEFVDNAASMGLPSFYSAGVKIHSGEVLVTGGMFTDLAKDPNLQEPRVLQEFRLLDMSNESITRPQIPANTMGHLFAFHTANLLRNNKVLIAGGVTSILSPTWFCDPQKKALFYYPWLDEEDAFDQEQISSITVALSIPRAGHTATELDDGTILVAGGITGAGTVVISDTAEVYNPEIRELRTE